jgi:glucose uptake protein
MILPQTYFAALALMLISMFCWGSWANTYKLAGRWRFELFYFDYAFGVFIAAAIFAATAGTLGFDGFTFIDDLMHAGKRQWLFGFLGGVVFNLANMLLVAAISLAGLAVAFPVGIGTALIIGVIWNYAIKPQGNPMLLFVGCGIIVVAIIVDAMAYRALALLRHEELAKAGKAKSTRRTVPVKGVVISLISGVLMGLFYPLVEKGKEGDLGLGPYAVGFVFAAGVLLSTFIFNLFFMNLPVEGEPVEVFDYFKGTLRQHALGLVGGMIWCTGMMASFCAASAPDNVQIGPAISYAVGQGATMVSALWGLLVWKEFAGADLKVKSLVVVMLALFVLGLGMVSVAPLFAR